MTMHNSWPTCLRHFDGDSWGTMDACNKNQKKDLAVVSWGENVSDLTVDIWNQTMF